MASVSESGRELVSAVTSSPGSPDAVGRLAVFAAVGQGQAPPTTFGLGAGSLFEVSRPIPFLPRGIAEAQGSKAPAERLHGGLIEMRRVSRHDSPPPSATGDRSCREPALDRTSDSSTRGAFFAIEDQLIPSAPASFAGMDETALGPALVLAGMPEKAMDSRWHGRQGRDRSGVRGRNC